VSGAASNGETFTVVPSPSSAGLSMRFLRLAGLPIPDLREIYTNQTSDAEFGKSNLSLAIWQTPLPFAEASAAEVKENPILL
jgi:hypothetical protein